MKKLINTTLRELVKNHIKDIESSLKTDYIVDVYEPLTFKIGDNYNKELEKFIKDIPYIYVFYIKKSLEFDFVKTQKDTLERNKDENEKYKMFQINEKHFKKDNKCLYVGSSIDLKTRLKEHLGFRKAQKTYALHLNLWYKQEEVVINIYKVADEKRRQLLEDLLWDKCKPLLGKQGKK